jgi:hypothetical protein
MSATLRTIAAAALATLLCGCGYIGEPLPPALNMFVPIADLTAVERGPAIIIDFTIPDGTTEHLVLKKRGDAELEIGGVRVPVPPDRFGPIHIETPAAPFVGREAAVRVRVLNARGRPSDWSNQVTLHIVEPLDAPRELRAGATANGVLLRWNSPRGTSFRILRGKQQAGTSDKPEWLDTQAAFDVAYEYSVQALLDGAESPIAGPIAITPEDTFPPAVPSGLQIIAGPGAIELAWDRNTEPDLKGYRVYRATGTGAFAPIADLIETPSFSDRNPQPGAQHRYAVTSIDQKGNESAKSEVVEIAAP